MTIQKILVPLDGSLLADGALAPVKRLLQSADAEVVLLAVVPVGALDHGAEKHVEAVTEALLAQGCRATAQIAIGDPAACILDVARAIEPSLVVIATHARSGLARLAKGSVAETVLRKCPYPVLLVNPRAHAEADEGRLRRILVPLDGTELAAEVLPLAREIAQRHDAEVILFHAVDVSVVLDPVPAISPAETPRDVAKVFERFRDRLEGVNVRVVATPGEPVDAILEAAEDERVDLIAIATHGRSGPARWLKGSVAEEVARRAPCPVLVHVAGGRAFSPAEERRATG